MANLAFESGQIIGDRYRLESKLGEGGMGAVWRAEHVTLRSPVAVKFINPGLAETEEALQRFMLEARSSAALRSSHIVQVFDFGIDDGVPYIAMELLQGESLAERLAREGKLDFEKAFPILEQTGRAVSYAHAAGIVHRDLKPDNVFLAREGDQELVKVLDFGIAKVLGGGLDATTGGGTRTGALMGTPFYVSPEQARGNKSVDHRTDVWALGVIAYECLVGDKPFHSDGLGDLLMKICGDDHIPPSQVAQVPPGLDAWMDQALAKDRDRRFDSVAEMMARLAETPRGVPGNTELAPTQLAGTPASKASGQLQVTASTEAGIESPLTLPTQRRSGLWIGAAVLFALGAIGVVFAAISPSPSDTSAPDTSEEARTDAASEPPREELEPSAEMARASATPPAKAGTDDSPSAPTPSTTPEPSENARSETPETRAPAPSPPRPATVTTSQPRPTRVALEPRPAAPPKKPVVAPRGQPPSPEAPDAASLFPGRK